MKILLVSREFPPHVYGGAGVHVEHLSAELADGVLVVKVAQLPKAKPRKITIGVKANGELPEATPTTK